MISSSLVRRDSWLGRDLWVATRTSGMRAACSLLLVFLLMGAFLTIPSSAKAEEPSRLSGLASDSTASVADITDISNELSSLQNASGKALHVAFVRDFGSTSSDDWAKKSARLSGFSRSDSLLAIAIDTKQFSVWAGGEGFTTSELKSAINSSVTSPWHEGKWLAGISALTKNLRGTSSSIEGASWLNPAAIIAIVAAILVLVVLISRRRQVKVGAQRAASTQENLADLERRASAALLDTDNGVRAAASEVEFAKAQFGVEATRPFTAALAQAQEALQKAFEIRKRLDDDIPETPAQRQEMNTQILTLTAKAHEAVSSQEAAFAKLRDFAAHLPTLLNELEGHMDELSHRIEPARALLDSLALTYPGEALETLWAIPSQISTLLQAAQKNVRKAREVAGSGSTSETAAAAPYARLSEEAVEQARSLLSQLENARSVLEEAMEKLPTALASLGSDVKDAARLGKGDPVVSARSRDAQAAIAYATGERVDPVRALAKLTEAENALDAALAPARSAEERESKAVKMRDVNRELARTAISEADAAINRYSRYASTRGRTLLADARALFTKAEHSNNAFDQAQLYEQARQQALTAKAESERDITRPRDSDSSNFGTMLGGMILGSILSGGNNRGGFSSASFGGFGGGGFGGGSSSSGGGSFGGSF